ncbi:hypothetical protein FB567DRAFT_194151 [Paraphoma chrysanthemicola]|uniref:Uncharacterized protein n=1 Tax=Paraphoma chrysanthemicola TaxID=798071 RepID=A0A8K0VTT7_9PLEO|nr:hypothetical protein FB567DRAFT_194151 [Paraphoma chrysanthemicola]
MASVFNVGFPRLLVLDHWLSSAHTLTPMHKQLAVKAVESSPRCQDPSELRDRRISGVGLSAVEGVEVEVAWVTVGRSQDQSRPSIFEGGPFSCSCSAATTPSTLRFLSPPRITWCTWQLLATVKRMLYADRTHDSALAANRILPPLQRPRLITIADAVVFEKRLEAPHAASVRCARPHKLTSLLDIDGPYLAGRSTSQNDHRYGHSIRVTIRVRSCLLFMAFDYAVAPISYLSQTRPRSSTNLLPTFGKLLGSVMSFHTKCWTFRFQCVMP